jgi:hypothetical protein
LIGEKTWIERMIPFFWLHQGGIDGDPRPITLGTLPLLVTGERHGLG